MPTVFQTFDKNGRPHPRWRFKFMDYNGKRKTATGATTKSETVKLANQIQADNDAIRKGWRPPPKPSEKPRPFAEVVAEYLAWGKSQGGHGGRPWSEGHDRMRKRHLPFWQQALEIDLLSDLNGCLPRVETVLRDLQDGRSGKTLQNYAESLAAFCDWAIERGYLDVDPLKNLKKFDTTPKVVRRALTADEVARLLAVASGERRLLYKIALTSGLRANELRSLLFRHLDVPNNGLRLEDGWTKGRKATFQPLPPTLVSELVATAGSDPAKPLLKVPKDTAGMICRDLIAAGIQRMTTEGKVDFHALRTAYTTFVFEVGASVKEAQTLARHSTPDLTLNVYARTRSSRLSDITQRVGDVVLGGSCPTDVQQQAAAANAKSAKQEIETTSGGNGVENSEGSSPDHAAVAAADATGRQQSIGGQELTQTGQPEELTKTIDGVLRTLAGPVEPNTGRSDCPTDVQRPMPMSGFSGFSGLATSSKQPVNDVYPGWAGFSGWSGCKTA
ncbi:MAG TPA: site-specific integrase [Planctomycetota bacterium]|jgi:integrase